MEEDHQIFENSEGGFGEKHATTFQEILMIQLQRCAKIGSQEMKAGFWKTIPTKFGGTATGSQKIWISDTRREYISAIQVLHDLLLARFDKEMHKQADKIQQLIYSRQERYAKEKKPETNFVDYELLMKRQLFQQLNLLIGRLKFFQESEGEG